jgi:hypothetical protein
MECSHTFDDVDFLLKRNWFLDIQDILSLFWELPEDIYQRVIEARNEYAPRIRDLLEFQPLPRPLKIHEVTEKDAKAEQDAKDMERERWVRAHRKAYTPPPRPRECIDDEIDAISEQLVKRRAFLEEVVALTNKTKKYLPPSQRVHLPVDPMVRDARADVQELENEFAFKSAIVEGINKTWTDLHWLDALPKDAVKRRLHSASNVAVN